ncbi:MAG: response regulator [bacterium]|nr:response regulator [bacterium]
MLENNRLVMIVDDDLNFAKMLQFLFTTKGFAVKSAINGVDALEMLKKNKPAAIILDILMPQMDGIEFMKKIKTDPLTKEVPVVVLSAAGSGESKKELLSLGACDYFDKPFKSEALVRRVAEAIEESKL